uniref:Uncharacterized protein n=1 Tax=mine drainage metagenome TaxID=410659 RepID=E6QVE2_9ZZZZ
MKRTKFGLMGVGLIAMGLSFVVKAGEPGECNLQVPFGPVSFEKEQPVAALRKILAGTGISLVQSGETHGLSITANNVSGTVDEAMVRLAEGTGLHYICRNGVMRVVQPLSTKVGTDLFMPVPEAQTLNSKKIFIQLHRGDSLKESLMAFAQRYHCVVHWAGNDLLAQQDALFTGSSVEAVAREFLLAAKMSAD